jgi:hypothetical protein
LKKPPTAKPSSDAVKKQPATGNLVQIDYLNQEEGQAETKQNIVY